MKPLDHKFYKRDRDAILLKQGGACHYCGKGLTRKTATLDHVIPLKKVKRHSKYNCVVSCLECNRRKGHQDAPVYSEYEWAVIKMLNALDDRMKRAQYRLSMDSLGSFKKWKAYHTKRGKWI